MVAAVSPVLKQFVLLLLFSAFRLITLLSFSSFIEYDHEVCLLLLHC